MAIAHEAGINLGLETDEKRSKVTPHITNLEPAGTHFMEDLEYAGGIPAVLKRLKSKLNNTVTVSGRRVFDIADTAEISDEEVIRPLTRAYHKQGGIAVLYGNLAPDGAVVKQSAVSPKMMILKTQVFNREEKPCRRY